ncbi:MAG: MBL fold metallo-hydrolase [Desulfobacterales bacterium]|jgi:metallo-beta-lactamase family protein|nr:MBL fold metallo-hydrolase [Desulfobacterales bacterium]
MQITFYGAAREVTGSMHLIASGSERILLDCGLFQGRRREAAEKNRVLPFDPALITNLVLSHAHTDHSGRIPVLTANGFNGRVVCTRATASACAYLLPDSASIQESDADYLNYKSVRTALSHGGVPRAAGNDSSARREAAKKILKKGRHELDVETINRLADELRIERVKPLYTLADAEKALGFFDGTPYRHPATIGAAARCTFYDAGHILGSAISILTFQENGRPVRVGFTGDLGRFGKPILNDPTLSFAEEDRCLNLLIMESTYGERRHEAVSDLKATLLDVLTETVQRGGTMLIPAFAFGRTQVLLYVLHELHNEGKLPDIPIYVDSPLATNLTRVFAEHPELYDRDAQTEFLSKGQNPFRFDRVRFVGSVEESMALNRQDRPQIIIAASGMCEAGRILHHLRFKIHGEKNTILIVGYMAQNTLGRRIEELGAAYAADGRQGPPPLVKFFNKEYPLRARVVKIGGFSAHADKEEMLRFLKQSNLKVGRIALVHGEEAQALSFAGELTAEGFSVCVPRRGESLIVN